jgi:hypothetical protein
MIHPDHLVTIYDSLRLLPPFCEWKLPPSDEIEFAAPLRLDCIGEYSFPPHKITVSNARCGTYQTALETMLHEMCHLSNSLEGTFKANNHGHAFRAKYKRVARLWGMDEKAF